LWGQRPRTAVIARLVVSLGGLPLALLSERDQNAPLLAEAIKTLPF